MKLPGKKIYHRNAKGITVCLVYFKPSDCNPSAWDCFFQKKFHNVLEIIDDGSGNESEVEVEVEENREDEEGVDFIGKCFEKKYLKYGLHRGVIAQYHPELEPEHAFVGRYATGIQDDTYFSLAQLRNVMETPSTSAANDLKRLMNPPTVDETMNEDDLNWWTKDGKRIDIATPNPWIAKKIEEWRKKHRDVVEEVVETGPPSKKARTMNNTIHKKKKLTTKVHVQGIPFVQEL